MDQTEFTTTYSKLGDKCRQVLELKLTNKPNKEIAQYLDAINAKCILM
ncbi:MAG: hypothetical protein HC836_13680 [Richelia sp. RM2_1_2]|nr:hypothetical protein [Richelia sp. RM2_1_2]